MENSTYEELDYNELVQFLFYEGFRNKQGRVEHRYYSTKSRENCDTYTTEFRNGSMKEVIFIRINLSQTKRLIRV